MKLPLLFLAVLTVVAGFVPFAEYVSVDGIPREMHLHLLFSIAPVSVALAGILLAGLFYYRESNYPDKVVASVGNFYRFALHKFILMSFISSSPKVSSSGLLAVLLPGLTGILLTAP